MVKLIPNQRRQLLANFEVLEILNHHQLEEKEKSKNRRKPVKSGEFHHIFKIAGNISDRSSIESVSG